MSQATISSNNLPRCLLLAHHRLYPRTVLGQRTEDCRSVFEAIHRIYRCYWNQSLQHDKIMFMIQCSLSLICLKQMLIQNNIKYSKTKTSVQWMRYVLCLITWLCCTHITTVDLIALSKHYTTLSRRKKNMKTIRTRTDIWVQQHVTVHVQKLHTSTSIIYNIIMPSVCRSVPHGNARLIWAPQPAP